MMFYKNPNKFKCFLLSMILIALGIVLTVFVGYRRMMNKNESHLSFIQGEAKMSISKYNHFATRNGIKEWRLDAGSAHYIDENRQAILQDLSVTFFLKDNREAYLSADHGILKTDSNNIEVTGDVMVSNRNVRLKTENLHYEHSGRQIYSKVPVQMRGDAFQFAAESMSFDLNSSRILLVGNVEGTFNEGFAL